MSLSQLRPLSFGEILDGAFSTYRRHFAAMFTTALLPLLPVALFWAGFGVLVRTDVPDEIGTATNLANLASSPLLLVVTMFMWGALTHQTMRALDGAPVEGGEAYRVGLRRLLPLVGAGLLVTLMAMMGFALLGILAVVGAPVALLVLGAVPALAAAVVVGIVHFSVWSVVVVEEKGAVASLARSRELARGAWGRIFGVWFVAMLIIMIPSGVVGGVAGAAYIVTQVSQGGLESAAAPMPVWLTAATNLLSTLMTAITTPFYVAAMTLLYLDRRVRTDALDLELAAEGLAGAAPRAL